MNSEGSGVVSGRASVLDFVMALILRHPSCAPPLLHSPPAPTQCGKPDDQGNILIPKLSYPSAEQLSYDGVYLLNCATVMYLLICPDVSAEVLQSLFGVPQLGQDDERLTLHCEQAPTSCVR